MRPFSDRTVESTVNTDFFMKWFWLEDLWLPPGASWSKIMLVENYDASDPLRAIATGFLLFAFRATILKPVFCRLGTLIGLKDRQMVKTLTPEDEMSLAKGLDVTERKLERLQRRKRKPKTLDKFANSSVYCLHYILLCTLGITVLWNKPWLWNWWSCLREMPYQPLVDGVWWYYSAQLAFYTSQILTDITGSHKRKDFFATVFHHVTTIILISFSWTINCTRMGSVVMILHDLADPILEGAKLFRYTKHQWAAEASFGCFVLVWIVTRLLIFPVFVAFLFVCVVKVSPVFHMLRVLLAVLLMVHVEWTVTIIRICHGKFTNTDQAMTDVRSDVDDDDDDEGHSSDKDSNSELRNLHLKLN